MPDPMEQKCLVVLELAGELTWWQDSQRTESSKQVKGQKVISCQVAATAGVSFHPATTVIAENILNEKLYEVIYKPT